MNIFKEVKEKVTAKEVAEYYGLQVNQKEMACCPFHNDRHPSMKIDETFYCFACGARGDAIDYVSKMFGLPIYEATLKIIKDLSLDIEIKTTTAKKPRVKRKKKVKTDEERATFVRKKLVDWLDHARDVLIRYHKWIVFWKATYPPANAEEDINPLYAEAVTNEAKINYYLDVLDQGEDEDKIMFFKTNRQEVDRIEERITEYERGVIDELGGDSNG